MPKRSPEEIKAMKKYLKPPTWQQISNFIEELDVSYAQFERYYGLKKLTLGKIKCGYRNLPIKHWRIIYEKIIPTYGIGSKNGINDTKNHIHKKIPKSASPGTVNKLNQIKGE